MIKFKRECSEKLSERVEIEFDICCAICNDRLLIRVVGQSKELHVLPCQNCKDNSINQDPMTKIILEKNNNILKDEAKQKEMELKKIEDRVYKKFEDRFKSLMKSDDIILDNEIDKEEK